MTIDYHITKFDSEIIQQDLIGYRIHKVELDVHWVSCGFYEISYPEFKFQPFPDNDDMWTVDEMRIAIDPE